METPSYYRERLNAIGQYSGLHPEFVTLFRNGHVPEHLKEDFEIDLKAHQTSDESPLSFAEITRFNTWFAMHPEKVCGTEKVTSSLEFPLTIKGNITDAVAQIRKEIKTKGTSTDKTISLAKAKAKALKLKLQLLNREEKLTGVLFKTKKHLIIK